MSTEYGLYHRQSKRFIWLGKPQDWGASGPPTRFQMPSERVAMFLASCVTGQKTSFELCPGTCNTPEDDCEKEWIQTDSWELDAPESQHWDNERKEYVRKEVL